MANFSQVFGNEPICEYARSYCEYDGDVEVVCGKCEYGKLFCYKCDEYKPAIYGRWVKNDYLQTVCSVCKNHIPVYWQKYDDCPDHILTEIKPTKYCPNCGQPMIVN